MKKVVFAVIAVLALVALSPVGALAARKSSVTFFQQSFLNQIGSMPSAQFLAPLGEADCEVNVYFENANRAAVLSVFIDWSDNVGPLEWNGNFSEPGALSAQHIPVHLSPTSDMSVHVDDSSGTQHYNFYVSGMCQ